MSFADAVRSTLTQYAVFSGRARRAEYWWFTLFNIIVMVAAFVLLTAGGDALGTAGVVLYALVALGLFLPGLAVTVRRLHDTGRSGWWFLLSFVPLGAFVVLYFLVQEGQPTVNAHGPSPKHEPVVDGDVAVAPAV